MWSLAEVSVYFHVSLALTLPVLCLGRANNGHHRQEWLMIVHMSCFLHGRTNPEGGQSTFRPKSKTRMAACDADARARCVCVRVFCMCACFGSVLCIVEPPFCFPIVKPLICASIKMENDPCPQHHRTTGVHALTQLPSLLSFQGISRHKPRCPPCAVQPFLRLHSSTSSVCM